MRKVDELSKPNTCMAHAAPNEMVFVLLSRDVAAPAAIRAWVQERIYLGKNTESDEQIIEALECARTMEYEGRKWVVSNAPCSCNPKTRCDHCGWPLRAIVAEGCVAENCSQRPMPDKRSNCAECGGAL